MAKKIEIFCGTGGVGKTTVSVSRGVDLALKGEKVLIITIDPAKRLKQVLDLSDDELGTVQTVDLTQFSKEEITGQLNGLLLSPKRTFNRIVGKNDNDIISTLSKPYGGMSEISAVLELDYHIKKDTYDVIILDTPPGQHFLDFLNSAKKINHFFDKNFAEIFNYIGKKNKPQRLFSKIFSTGVDKLLNLLEKVTGKGFVNEFIEAVHLLYQHREKFIKAIKVEDYLLNTSTSTWYLVSSADQIKANDAESLLKSINEFRKDDTHLIINRSWNSYIESWSPEDITLIKLKEKILSQDKIVKDTAKKYSVNFLEFPEVFSSTPIQQVQYILTSWNIKQKRYT